MITRRRMLGSGALVCACHALPMELALADTRPAAEAASPLRELGYDAVKLGAGLMREQFEHQQQLFLTMDDDRLLKPFRVRAGLDAPGADMGGWYDASPDFHIDPNDWGSANWHGFIPGHSFGQYMSGLARGYAVTGDAPTLAGLRLREAGILERNLDDQVAALKAYFAVIKHAPDNRDAASAVVRLGARHGKWAEVATAMFVHLRATSRIDDDLFQQVEQIAIETGATDDMIRFLSSAIDQGGVPWPVEVNPRYSASVEVVSISAGSRCHVPTHAPATGAPAASVTRPTRSPPGNTGIT